MDDALICPHPAYGHLPPEGEGKEKGMDYKEYDKQERRKK